MDSKNNHVDNSIGKIGNFIIYNIIPEEEEKKKLQLSNIKFIGKRYKRKKK